MPFQEWYCLAKSKKALAVALMLLQVIRQKRPSVVDAGQLLSVSTQLLLEAKSYPVDVTQSLLAMIISAVLLSAVSAGLMRWTRQCCDSPQF